MWDIIREGDKMIVIIGATEHGRNTLAKAIEQLTNIKCEVIETRDLREIKIQDIMEEIKFGEIQEIEVPVNNYRKKNKRVKNWQKNKHYQK